MCNLDELVLAHPILPVTKTANVGFFKKLKWQKETDHDENEETLQKKHITRKMKRETIANQLKTSKMNRQKSTRKAQIDGWRLLLLPATQKGCIKNVDMRQKTVQSHCNNVRRQRFHNKRALTRTSIKHLEQLKVLENMKKKAADSNEQWRKVDQDTTATITRECAVALPKYKNLAQSIQRQRALGNNPFTMITMKDVAILSELQLTLRRENFLAYHSGSDDRERFFFLALSKIWISSNTLPNGTQREHLNTVQPCFTNCIQFTVS